MNIINCRKRTIQRVFEPSNRYPSTDTAKNTSTEDKTHKNDKINNINQIIDLQQFENKEYLNRLLHPIMRTNRIRCTDISKYQKSSKKNVQLIQMNNIPNGEKTIMEETAPYTPVVEDVKRTENISLIPDDQTNLEYTSDNKDDTVTFDNGVNNSIEDNGINYIDQNEENCIKKENEQEAQKVNIAINASPFVLELLKGLKISDYISIIPLDDSTEKPLDSSNAETDSLDS